MRKNILSISQNEIQESKYLIDVSGYKIGRCATYIAQILLGKLNPRVRSNLDPMVKVFVINASQLDVTQKRKETTFFSRYSGYPGGLKFENLGELMESNPAKALILVVKGMLPKTKIGRKVISRLYVYNHGIDNNYEQNVLIKLDLSNLKL
ncbi:MAG: 50S ribosomal protein L13 [Candidatus Dojkabacteria bacterium]|nr:50S ribosomal protein L13 [Candidatus Dojkabacteria bacterium]